MEKVNCLVCDSSNKKTLLSYSLKDSNNNNFFLAYCYRCDFSYLNPRLEQIYIKSYYNDDYIPLKNTKNSLFDKIYSFVQTFTFYWKRIKISNYSSFGKELLDIGAGNNKFSLYMSKYDFNCESYDEFSKSVDYNSLSKIPKKTYDHITLWHSIEHIYDIESLFKKILEVSKQTTYLYIACPNFYAFERTYLKDKWPAYDAPRHLYHFSYKSMSKLLLKYNFEIVNTSIMIQDTFFNIFLTRKLNIFKKLYVLILSLINIVWNKKKASSLLYICRIK